MANERSQNVIFIDSTGNIAGTDEIIVTQIIISADGGNAEFQLSDQLSGNPIKVKLLNPSSEGPTLIDLSSNPMFFQDGVKVDTATNVAVTLMYKKRGGS